MSVETIGRLEYELDASGKRTGRWRPREGSGLGVQQGMYRVKPPEKWRKGAPTAPVEAAKK